MPTPRESLRALAEEALQETVGRGGNRREAFAVLLNEAATRFNWAEFRGNNRGPFIDEVMRDKLGLAWCVGLPLHLASLVGLKFPGGFYSNRSSRTLLGRCKRAGLFLGPNVLPQPGDIRFQYGRGMSDDPKPGLVHLVRHVGTVTGTETMLGARPMVHTIDGNWNNDIAFRRIPHGHKSTAGYVRLGPDF